MSLGVLYLATYGVYIATGGAAFARNALILAVSPLFLRATFKRRDFPSFYGLFGILLLALTLVVVPIDFEVLFESMGTFAAVVGLLAFLRAMGQPLDTESYRRAFRIASLRLQSRGIKIQSAGVVLSFLLGQLIAYAIVPVIHQTFVPKDASVDDSRVVALWATRGFAVAVMSSVTFPIVSIVLNEFSVTPGQFLLRALPAALLILLLLTGLSLRDQISPPPSLPIHSDRSSTFALVRIGVYFLVTIGAVVILGSIFDGVSYLAVVAGVVGVASTVLALLEAVVGRRDGLRSLKSYVVRWPDIAMPEVSIFMGSGCVLYAIYAFGVIGLVVDLFVVSVGIQNRWVGAPYHLAFLLIAILFWFGIHPIVSSVIVAQAVSIAAIDSELSLPTVTFAIVAGAVAGMLISPFSALSNLWASITEQRVTRIVAANGAVAFGFILLSVGYLELLAQRGV